MIAMKPYGGSSADVIGALSLIALVTDPEGYAAKVIEIGQAREDLAAAFKDLEAGRAALFADREKWVSQTATEGAELDARAQAIIKAEANIATREKAAKASKAAADDLMSKAKAAMAGASEAKAEVETREASISSREAEQAQAWADRNASLDEREAAIAAKEAEIERAMAEYKAAAGELANKVKSLKTLIGGEG